MTTRIKEADLASTTLESLDWLSGFTGGNSDVWGGGAVNLDGMTVGAKIIDCQFISNWNGFKDDQTHESTIRGGAPYV